MRPRLQSRGSGTHQGNQAGARNQALRSLGHGPAAWLGQGPGCGSRGADHADRRSETAGGRGHDRSTDQAAHRRLQSRACHQPDPAGHAGDSTTGYHQPWQRYIANQDKYTGNISVQQRSSEDAACAAAAANDPGNRQGPRQPSGFTVSNKSMVITTTTLKVAVGNLAQATAPLWILPTTTGPA